MWDFKLRKRASKPKEPVCIHEWFLVDLRTVDAFIWNESPDMHYEVVCKSCTKRKLLDRYEYGKFCATFDVKGGREDATH